MLSTGRIHSVESFGAVDGPGIRFVVFFQGCPLRCAFCHNPDTWDFSGGGEVTADEMLGEILKYKSFLKKGGVTLSGGEPLAQPAFCAELLRLCKENGLHTAVDTSGAIPLDKCQEAVDLADLLLLDIKALDPNLCKTITGQSNQNALALLNHREETGKPVWIRHVLVPGLTLDMPRLQALADFLRPYKCVEKVELLPYHSMGAYKWEALGLPYTLKDTPEPTEGELRAAEAIFI